MRVCGGTQPIINFYCILVKRLFPVDIDIEVYAAVLRFSIVLSVSYTFLHHLILHAPRSDKIGLCACVLFSMQAAYNCLDVYANSKPEIPQTRFVRTSSAPDGSFGDDERTDITPKKNSLIRNVPTGQLDRPANKPPNQQVLRTSANSSKSPNDRKTEKAPPLRMTIVEHELDMIKNSTGISGLSRNMYARVHDGTRHIVVIVSVGYSKVTNGRLQKLDCDVDIAGFMKPFLNLIPETIFIVLTDDSAKLIELSERPYWGPLNDANARNYYGNPTLNRYKSACQKIAQRTDKYRLITSFGAHGKEGSQEGGIYLVSENLKNSHVVRAGELHDIHASFVENRKKSFHAAKETATVLFWTIVLDVCYAKRAIQLPVNFKIEKYIKDRDVHVRIKRDDTLENGQTRQKSFDHAEVVLVCLYASDYKDVAHDVWDPIAKSYRGQFSWLVNTETLYQDRSSLTTLVKLVAGLNTCGGNPVDMLLQFANRMDSKLATERKQPVYWSTNFPSHETMDTHIVYNEDLIYRHVDHAIRTGQRVI
ncbi:hypothetical protein T484DRAFT_1756662 [Baffinella frigidus]|nr:hypothetical protein T484DRAFT_1756662 [Cryptophyta sp. CCMP2293]